MTPPPLFFVMPMIEFESPSGERREEFHHKAVNQIVVDGVVWKRALIPSTLRFGGFATPMTQEDEVKRDCYKYECSQKPWTSKYTKSQIKKIWDI